MTIGTWISTKLRGKYVGQDRFGNRYYTERRTPKGRRRKRWVWYKGFPEPSKVPPLWHAWMHYMIDTTPDEMQVPHHAWQKEHVPNLTGTTNAYVPPGHLGTPEGRDPSTSDYQAWKPGS